PAAGGRAKQVLLPSGCPQRLPRSSCLLHLGIRLVKRPGPVDLHVLQLSHPSILHHHATKDCRGETPGEGELSRSAIVSLRSRMKLVRQLTKDMGESPDGNSSATPPGRSPNSHHSRESPRPSQPRRTPSHPPAAASRAS